jgi:hypothetical protein
MWKDAQASPSPQARDANNAFQDTPAASAFKTVAAVLPSKLDDVGAEPLLVVSTTPDLALRRAMLASRLRGSWDLAYARLGHPAQDGSHGSDQDDQGDKADVNPALQGQLQ